MSQEGHRVLVCGTNYGQRYLDAVRTMRGEVELAGIFARGSVRSLFIAARERVPLWTDLAEVPPIDLACVAMGPGGHATVLGLLERGVHVLHEHPVHSEQLAEAWAHAQRSGAQLHVNAHFALLPAPRSFAAQGQGLCSRSGPPRRVRIRSNRRSFYGALDLLRRVLGPLSPGGLRLEGFEDGFFRLTTELARVPTTLELEAGLNQEGRPLPDGASHHLVDIAVELTWKDVVLTLSQLAGPVNRSDRDGRLDKPQSRSEQARSRLAANREAIRDLVHCARGAATPAEQRIESLLEVSRCAYEAAALLAEVLQRREQRPSPGAPPA